MRTNGQSEEAKSRGKNQLGERSSQVRYFLVTLLGACVGCFAMLGTGSLFEATQASDWARPIATASQGQGKDLGFCSVLLDVPYVVPADNNRLGDLFLPKTPGKHPAVVLIHGGGWRAGNKRQATGIAMELARNGFAVFNVNYRLVGQGGQFPNNVIDVKDALAFLVQHAQEWDIDPEHIASMGGSAGGHLSMLLGYTNTSKFAAAHYPNSKARVKAVVSWYGPTDLSVLGSGNMIVDYIGRTTDGARIASPMTYVKSAVPTLMVHGTNDPLIPISQSESLAKALTAARVMNKLAPIEGAQHGFVDHQWVTAMSDTVQFLKTQLSEASHKN